MTREHTVGPNAVPRRGRRSKDVALPAAPVAIRHLSSQLWTGVVGDGFGDIEGGIFATLATASPSKGGHVVGVDPPSMLRPELA